MYRFYVNVKRIHNSAALDINNELYNLYMTHNRKSTWPTKIASAF